MPALIVLALSAAVMLPLLRFLLLPLLPMLAPEFTPPSGPLPGLGAAASTSLLVSAAAGLLAAPLATVLGFLIECRDWRGRRLCIGACWAAVLLPGYLLVAGWEIVLDAVTPLALPHEAGVVSSGLPLLVGALGAKALPLTVLAARLGWAMLPPGLEDAARINLRGTGPRIRLLLSASWPILGLAFFLGFDQAIDEYGIAVVLSRQLHLHLLASEVHASLSEWPVSWPHAAICADLLVACSLLPFLPRLRGRREPVTPDFADKGRLAPARLSARVVAWALLAVMAVPGLLIPVLALASDLGGGSGWSVSAEGGRGLLFSALYGLVASTAAVALAVLILAASAADASRAALPRLLPLLSLSFPGIVLGAAFVIGYGDAPVPVLGTPLALLLAETVQALPVGLLLLRDAMGAGMRVRSDAARVHGVRRLVRIERIHAPPLLRPVATAWCFCFCRLFFELPLAQMLAPAGREPVGVVLIGLGESLRLHDEAVLACAGMAVCGAVVLAAGVVVGWLR